MGRFDCICVSRVLILPLSKIFPFDLGIVSTVWYILFFIIYIYNYSILCYQPFILRFKTKNKMYPTLVTVSKPYRES